MSFQPKLSQGLVKYGSQPTRMLEHSDLTVRAIEIEKIVGVHVFYTFTLIILSIHILQVFIICYIYI